MWRREKQGSFGAVAEACDVDERKSVTINFETEKTDMVFLGVLEILIVSILFNYFFAVDNLFEIEIFMRF